MSGFSAEATTAIDRTKTGRALLRLREGVRAWIAENAGRSPPDAILAAETLCCELYSAATNGLAMERAALLESIDRIQPLLRR